MHSQICPCSFRSLSSRKNPLQRLPMGLNFFDHRLVNPGRYLTTTTAASTRETTIEFRNQQGEKLVGTLVEPSPPPPQAAAAAAAADALRAPASSSSSSSSSGHASSQAAPVVLLAHGYMSSRNSELLVRLSTALARSCQLSSFRFDFSGNGESEGEFRYGQYRSEAQELGLAKLHLEQQLGRRVIAMLGHSKGATDVLIYAGCYADQYGPVSCIVNLAARLDVRQGVVRRLGQRVLDELAASGKVEMSGHSRSRGKFTWWLRKEDLEDRLATDVAAACRQIPATSAVLTVHGTADADVPVADAREFDKLIQNHKLVVLEGADHTFSSSGAMYELAAAVLPFISTHAQQQQQQP